MLFDAYFLGGNDTTSRGHDFRFLTLRTDFTAFFNAISVVFIAVLCCFNVVSMRFRVRFYHNDNNEYSGAIILSLLLSVVFRSFPVISSVVFGRFQSFHRLFSVFSSHFVGFFGLFPVIS